MPPRAVQAPFDTACAWQQTLWQLNAGAQRALASERPETAADFLGALAHLADTMQLYLHARQTAHFSWQSVPVTLRAASAPHTRPQASPLPLLPPAEYWPDQSGEAPFSSRP